MVEGLYSNLILNRPAKKNIQRLKIYKCKEIDVKVLQEPPNMPKYYRINIQQNEKCNIKH
jgi:hypothetical protein